MNPVGHCDIVGGLRVLYATQGIVDWDQQDQKVAQLLGSTPQEVFAACPRSINPYNQPTPGWPPSPPTSSAGPGSALVLVLLWWIFGIFG